jgi:hypothetical protein
LKTGGVSADIDPVRTFKTWPAGFAGQAVRYRYLLLALWLIPWFLLANGRGGGLSDWLYFEFGARTLIHYNAHYGGGALSLYANHPVIQIGPPPLLVVAAVQWLPHNPSSLGLAALMALLGLWAVRCAETIAHELLPASQEKAVTLRVLWAAIPALAVWSYEAGRWRHLDDVIAITFTLAACSLIARRRHWWLAGLLVGLAVASKPWAIVMAPALIGLPRAERPKAAIVAMATAAACWVPFVLGGRGTLHALGSYRLEVTRASTLHLLGVHSLMAPAWVRPVQLVGGFVLMALLARRSHWAAVPFAGLAFRVVTDPQTWMYYGLGPLMAAMLWDGLHERRFPLWTVLTLVVEYAVPTWVPGTPAVAGAVRLAWAVAVLVSCVRYGRLHRAATDPSGRPAGRTAPELQAVA